MFDYNKTIEAVKMLLDAFGKDIQGTDLEETPRRVAGYWNELLEGEKYTNKEIAEKYGKTFITNSNPLVVKKIENLYSHCEHHLALMYNMTVIVAYLPVQVDEQHFKVIGLSKIPRIAELCCKRLQLQEKIASDIAECISLATGSNDVYVNIKADHACVSARGARSPGLTDVTHLQGRFATDSELRSEIERKVL